MALCVRTWAGMFAPRFGKLSHLLSLASRCGPSRYFVNKARPPQAASTARLIAEPQLTPRGVIPTVRGQKNDDVDRHDRKPNRPARACRTVARVAVRGGAQDRRALKKCRRRGDLETGYGPSGLPHIGTFGEVARTTMVRHAFRVLTDDKIKTRLIAFSDDMTGCARCRQRPQQGDGGAASRQAADQGT